MANSIITISITEYLPKTYGGQDKEKRELV